MLHTRMASQGKNEMRLAEKVAIITGVEQGLGLGIEQVLGQPGFFSVQCSTVLDPATALTRYLASYEVERDDPHATLQAVRRR